MMNVYNGNVVTDADGLAVVTAARVVRGAQPGLPLPAHGSGRRGRAGFVQVKVARKIAANRFTIRASAPGVEVSWQVTGIRKDPFAEKYRIPVEEDKPEGERGTYLHPDAWGSRWRGLRPTARGAASEATGAAPHRRELRLVAGDADATPVAGARAGARGRTRAHAQSYELSWWTVDGGAHDREHRRDVRAGRDGRPARRRRPLRSQPLRPALRVLALAASGAVGPQADLSITKTDGQATATPGTIVTYTIVTANAWTVSRVRCAGDGRSSGCAHGRELDLRRVVRRHLPAVRQRRHCRRRRPAARWHRHAHAHGHRRARRDRYARERGVDRGAQRRARVGSSDNQATDTDTLTPSADLSIAVADLPDPVAAGTSLTYTVTVTNIGAPRCRRRRRSPTCCRPE